MIARSSSLYPWTGMCCAQHYYVGFLFCQISPHCDDSTLDYRESESLHSLNPAHCVCPWLYPSSIYLLCGVRRLRKKKKHNSMSGAGNRGRDGRDPGFVLRMCIVCFCVDCSTGNILRIITLIAKAPRIICLEK